MIQSFNKSTNTGKVLNASKEKSLLYTVRKLSSSDHGIADNVANG
jgi:hypothetical protein